MKRMNRMPLVWFALYLCVLLPSCKQEAEPVVLPDPGQLQEAFALSNKHLIMLEEEAINDFIARYGWNMEKSGSGLRYKIRDKGSGRKASFGDVVLLEYTMYLITGDPVYSSSESGPLRFIVGRGGVERGLEEGILLLADGGSAVFIMPHHLAHGVPGDGKRIPKRATIVLEVDNIEIQ